MGRDREKTLPKLEKKTKIIYNIMSESMVEYVILMLTLISGPYLGGMHCEFHFQWPLGRPSKCLH